ncbi:unnamed protein product (macronuclear) [Paramecium tetraurelia]|uniref:Uncharacterized protein n=1 Tax=Paramecium tetraurelia TaxID=5888 RepID=A0E2F5_PARTE|nr:uncharacterized protein GSPATT00022644001 [Paramecium tetraurelia]CAK89472.1 unnamed protein product [Paramecium tetraurelia]|eukprot:XP_001456869.1 hypothetical protein (macronuclear) [Paramecium tetraurelia strain d4-2]
MNSSQYGAFGMSGNNFNQGKPPVNNYNFENVRAQQPAPGGPQPSRGKPIGTAARQPQAEARPMTSNRGANFGQKKDPFNSTQNQLNLNKPKLETNPEEQFKSIEKEINNLIEQSAMAKLRGNLSECLEKAKEAFNKEKKLRQSKEAQNLAESINTDLSYCAALTQACALHANGLHQDALTKYQEIIKCKQYPQAGRLRVNMGNIYFEQKKYSYCNQNVQNGVRFNTCYFQRDEIQSQAQVRIGKDKINEAITTYEQILKSSPDFPTGFNLMICLYLSGNKTKMKDYFVTLLTIEIPGENEEENNENKGTTITDKLREDTKERRREAIYYIVTSAKLIAPLIEDDIIIWIRMDFRVVKEFNISQKLKLKLKFKNIEKSIETLKGFEKKDKQIMARIATNISFLYFLENDYKQAEKYAEIAITYDRYNAKALVNRGNCLYVKNEFLRAKEQYLEAIGVEADCIEALYNLAYVNRKLNMFVESLQALDKLQTIVCIPEVLYQMATLYEMTGNSKQAMKWYLEVMNKVPNDPNILARLGSLFAREDDEPQALHYFQESYRILPTNIETISWLGVYYVKQEMYEKASLYFERAAQVQSRDVKWKLMVASCYRRMGHFQKALGNYQKIYSDYPDNIECLRFLVQLCREMGQPYEEYAGQLRKLEREMEMMDGYQGQDINLINNEEEQVRLPQGDDNPVSFTNNTRRGNKQPPPKTNVRQNIDDEQFQDGVEDNFLP